MYYVGWIRFLTHYLSNQPADYTKMTNATHVIKWRTEEGGGRLGLPP